MRRRLVSKRRISQRDDIEIMLYTDLQLGCVQDSCTQGPPVGQCPWYQWISQAMVSVVTVSMDTVSMDTGRIRMLIHIYTLRMEAEK